MIKQDSLREATAQSCECMIAAFRNSYIALVVSILSVQMELTNILVLRVPNFAGAVVNTPQPFCSVFQQLPHLRAVYHSSSSGKIQLQTPETFAGQI